MMNCEEFQDVAQALARDESLDVAIVEGALTHADSCGSSATRCLKKPNC